MVKSWKFWAVLTAACALGGWAWKKHKTEAPDAAESAEVSRGDLEKHFVDSGEIAPKNYVDVASQVSGRIVTMTVEEGSKVHKGDELCVIQPGRSEAERYVATSVKAPIDGVVMRYQRQGNNGEPSALARVGDYVTGLVESNSPTYLLTVADLTKLVVRMKISEMDVLKLREGMAVDVTVDAVPGAAFPAKVSVISPQAEKDQNGIKSFRVDVALVKNDPRLKPGMTARVDGLLESRRGVLKIPLSAVFEEHGKDIAYVGAPGAKEKPVKVNLKLGLRNETDAELLDGPKAGEKLLTEKPLEKPAS